VFDGHGSHGTPCAEFARDNVPLAFVQDPNCASAPHFAFYNSCVDTNARLHESDIDDTMSGTTCIAAFLRGWHLYVANVGDSRAVISEARPDGTFFARDLSTDQTPYHPRELARVRQSGAVVLTLDQLEGFKDPTVDVWLQSGDDGGDPPRLWVPHNTLPGTAFTRSLGDSVAERIGVHAVPEVLIKKLSREHRHLVVASDGVFEFMSSQQTIDMISRFDDLEEGAAAICCEAFRLWLENEVRTDDITIVVVEMIFDDDVDPGPPERDVLIQDGTGIPEKATTPSEPRPAKPVPAPSSEPKRVFRPLFPVILPLSGEEMSEDAPVRDWSTREIDPAVSAVMTRVARLSIVLSDISEEEHRAICSVVQPISVSEGEAVITQGEPSTGFFVVLQGELEATVVHADGSTQATILSSSDPDGAISFGEIGLLCRKPRSGTVVAKTDAELLFLERADLKAVLALLDMRDIVVALRRLPALAPLMPCELQHVQDVMTREAFDSGAVMVHKGSPMDAFFFVLEGELVEEKDGDGGKPGEIMAVIKALEGVGTEALSQKRKTLTWPHTIRARGATSVLKLMGDVHVDAVGPIDIAAAAHAKWSAGVVKRTPDVERAVLPSAWPAADVLADLRDATELEPSLDHIAGVSSSGLPDDSVCGPICRPPRRYVHRNTGRVFLTRPAAGTCWLAGTKPKLNPSLILGPDAMARVPASAVVPRSARVLHDASSAGSAAIEVIATPSAPACSLHDLVAHAGPLDPDSVAWIAASVAAGLEDMHRSAVIYRGLSPDSIIFSEDGRILLSEARFARVVEGRTYTMCGQPECMAPEMVEMRGHTQAVDWWALGICLHFALTGSMPWAGVGGGEDEVSTFLAILEGTVEPPKGAPPALVALVAGLLDRNPVNRFGHGIRGLARLAAHPHVVQHRPDDIRKGTARPPGGLGKRIQAWARETGMAVDGTWGNI